MTADLTPCPPVTDLERLLAEGLSDPERNAVETHVEACTLCQEQLARLSATNVHSVVPLAAVPAGPDPEPEAAFLDRLRQLAGGPSGEWRPTVPKPAPDPRFPDGRLGRYEMLERIAVGGMGVVYRARHVDLDKVVAIKVLPAGDVGEVNLARFRNEMRAIGGLRHPNIVTAHDAGDANGVHYLAMDLVDGIDLARLTRRHERLPVADACEALRQAALGLQHAFERGLVHRDLKPSNLMLSRGGIVQVLDLGLARAAGTPSERLTATGALLGTADYLAPEQWERPHSADVRADVYGLGCTLYHLLAGRPPFVGDKYANPMAKMRGHHEDPPPPISAVRPDVPPGLAAILDRMLAKDPAARFQTPAEVAEALTPFAAGADLVRLLEASGDAIESTVEAARTPGPATRETMRTARGSWPGRAHRWYALPAAVAVLGLVFACWHLWPRRKPPAPPVVIPLVIDKFRVNHYRTKDRKTEDLGDIRTSPEVRLNDDVRVTARFSRPAYCYLIAFNPDGSEQLCHPAFDGADPVHSRTVPPSPVTEVRFFPEERVYFTLDLTGLQVFVLVTSVEPLPSYADWRAKVGPIPWRAVFDGGESRWQFNGGEVTRLAEARGGKKDRGDPVPQAFGELTDFLKTQAGPAAVRALAFPVANTDPAWRLKAIELDLARNGKFEEAQEPVQELIELYRKQKGDGDWKTEETRRELAALQAIAALPAEDRTAYARALWKLDEAGVFQRQGRYPQAVGPVKEGLDVLARYLGPHHIVTAEVALGYGSLLRNAGKAADAEKVFRGALADITATVGDGHPSAAAARVGLALTLHDQERPTEAGPLLEQALAIATRLHGEDHADTAVVLNNLAGHFERQGEYGQAESRYRRAIEILVKADGETGRSTLTARHNFAYHLTGRGKLAEGEQLYRRVLRARRDVLPAGHPDIAMTCNNLAANLDQQGRHAEAEMLYREVRDLYLRRFGPDSPLTAMANNGLAMNQNNQGKYEDAGPLYEAALEALNRTGRGRTRPAAVVHSNLSSNLRAQGRLDAALQHIEEAHDIFREVLDDKHPDLAGCLNNMAVTYEALNRHADADQALRFAVANFEPLGKDHPQTILAAANLAVLRHKRGRYADADLALSRALADHRRVLGEAHPETAWAYRNLAANHWAHGAYAAALALGPEALASFEAARRRISFAGLDRARRTDDISPLDYLAAAAAQNQGRDAWKYLEAGLARGLLDELAAQSLTDDERARERQLFRDLDARPKERDETRKKLAEFQATLTAKYGVAAGTVLDLADIQKALAPETALVAWLDLAGKPDMPDPAGDHWACVVRSKGDPTWVRLPADDPAPALVRKRLASRSTVDEMREATERLRKQRIAPIEKHLAAGDGLPAVRRLVVLPSGDMAGIPVEALNDLTVSYAPSGTVFAGLHGDRPTPIGEPSLLAVGDPAVGEGAARLPGTRIEVEAIARLFARPRVLLGANASEANLDHLADSGDLAGFRFLHFAAHGHLDDRRPFASALALADDGRLTVERVLRTWKLRADLVTLSACNSGLGEYSGGEGYLGFAQALFRAGARSTVVGLWRVDDRATALLMTRFYENLLGKGKPAVGKAEALAEAKRWLRDLTAAEVEKLDRDLTADTPRGQKREGDVPTEPAAKPFAHPHYWSAFILIGDSR